MNLPVRESRNQRGVALPLALFALVMLSGLLLAFLTMAGIEVASFANLSQASAIGSHYLTRFPVSRL